MTRKDLEEIMEDHIDWLNGEGGERANLRGANLRDADLRGANLRGANLPHFQIPEGTLIVYKKVDDKIVTLRISAKTKRTASLVGRKCRAEKAFVVDIEGGKDVDTRGLVYSIGKTVKPDSYDDDIRVECTNGIHFFCTRKEAEEYS